MENTYEIEFKATTFRTYEVEASSKEEAEELAFERLDSDPDASSAWKNRRSYHIEKKANLRCLIPHTTKTKFRHLY